MLHKVELIRRALDLLDTTLWEHQPWEAEVRKALEEYEIFSDDYTLKIIMEYAFPGEDSLSNASARVQEMYDGNPEAYDALISEVIDYVRHTQNVVDRMNKTDYGWEKDL